MASPTRWMWVWVNSGSWWRTGRPSVLRFMGLQRVRHNWGTELTDWLKNYGVPFPNENSVPHSKHCIELLCMPHTGYAKSLALRSSQHSGRYREAAGQWPSSVTRSMTDGSNLEPCVCTLCVRVDRIWAQGRHEPGYNLDGFWAEISTPLGGWPGMAGYRNLL